MVKQNIPTMEKSIVEYLQKKPKRPGESAITALLDTDENGHAQILVVAVADDLRIVREVERFRLTEFIETLLKKAM
jgi:hypothetical protein